VDRVTERLAVAVRALERLEDAAGPPAADPLRRDAAIQRFEFTFEATWKAAQQYLREAEGLDTGSPKAAVRACGRVWHAKRRRRRRSSDHGGRPKPDGAHVR
jgi:hypothetical protein